MRPTHFFQYTENFAIEIHSCRGAEVTFYVLRFLNNLFFLGGKYAHRDN